MSAETDARREFVSAARSAIGLLRDPAVTAAWDKPSALESFSVAGLAGHLAFQILVVPRVLAAAVPSEETVSLLEHYARVQWIGADLDDEINVRIRRDGRLVHNAVITGKTLAVGAVHLKDEFSPWVRRVCRSIGSRCAWAERRYPS